MTNVLFASLVLSLSLLATPKLQIVSPSSGWTTQRTITVAGTAEDVKSPAVLVVNGVERPIPIQEGRFEATFALGSGENLIVMQAETAEGRSLTDAINLFARVPKVDLQVLLFWDTDGTDVDLHVVEPTGEEVFYAHRESKSTGGRLDRDDVDGYGPEIYTVASAPEGPYGIMTHYFGGSDRAGQTMATVIAVAREGTDEERRWRFATPLIQTGARQSLATIRLPGLGLRMIEAKIPKP